MIGECLEGDRLFGVVLIKSGIEALGPLAEPYTIGCTARIVETTSLEEGRMQITAVGERRFRIRKLKDNLSYLVGEVEYHPMLVKDPEELEPAAERLSPKVRQYIKLLKQIEPIELDPGNLPEDPLKLGYLATALLQMPPEEKQDLLDSESALELITSTNQVYSREIAFLRAIIKRGKDKSQTPVSQN